MAWQFPMLAQRAGEDSPRWTRALREPARPPLEEGLEKSERYRKIAGAFSLRPTYFPGPADFNASNTAGSREKVLTYSSSAPFSESSKAPSPAY